MLGLLAWLGVLSLLGLLWRAQFGKLSLKAEFGKLSLEDWIWKAQFGRSVLLAWLALLTWLA